MTRLGALVGAVLLLAGSAATAAAEARARLVFVTSNGWHTGIVVARADLPPDRLPEAADFPAARYLEFGWGDRVYYPAPRKDIGMTLGAAFPGPAIMHVAGLDAPPTPRAGLAVARLALAPEQFRRLVDYLDAGFERRGAARVASTGRGLHPDSLFYPATGSFHLFNTCNTWVARALATAGLPVRVAGVQRAEDVMAQLRAPVAPLR